MHVAFFPTTFRERKEGMTALLERMFRRIISKGRKETSTITNVDHSSLDRMVTYFRRRVLTEWGISPNAIRTQGWFDPFLLWRNFENRYGIDFQPN